MIPFAVKQVWFGLALTGLIQCWATLLYLGRNLGGLWGRLYYCVFITLLEGIFCIGMAWRMDPSRMPRSFCIAQAISFSLGFFALNGLCASFTLACARVVFRPQNLINSRRAVLAWHLRYTPLILFFPIAACITYATLLVTLDAVQPSLSDDFHCDATNPIWMRLVGYAGVPLIVAVPFFVLSIVTAFRLYRVRRLHHTRGTYNTGNGEGNDGEGEYGATTPHSDRLHGPKRRSAFSLNAFLPFPVKTNPKNPVPVSPQETAFDIDDSPLHKHPFPVIDIRTGNPYSPSVDGGEAAISEASIHMASTHIQSRQHTPSPFTKHPQTASPQPPQNHHDRNGTPDSNISSTIPIFGANRTLTPATPSANAAIAIGNSSRLTPSTEEGDTNIGLAITVGDSPSPRVSTEAGHSLEEAVMGLAVTTDEPELRSITPTPQLRASSPLRTEIYVGLASSDTLQPRDPVSQQQTVDAEPDVIVTARSPESVTLALPPDANPQQPNHPIPQISSAPDVHSSPHHQFLDFVSSGTGSGVALTYTDGEERNLLPSSPASASFLHPQTATIYSGIDLAMDLGLGHQASKDKDGDRKRNAKVAKSMKWEGDHDMSMQTAKKLDRREMYNPTISMPTSVVLDQRRERLQWEAPNESDVELGGVIWRMLLFQIAFFLIQMVACLSSLLDVARHTITPFGTQHVALILVAWGPLFVFASVPNIGCFRKRHI